MSDLIIQLRDSGLMLQMPARNKAADELERQSNAAAILAQQVADLTAENVELRTACSTGWGEPQLIKTLTAERDALRADGEVLAKANIELDGENEALTADIKRMQDEFDATCITLQNDIVQIVAERDALQDQVNNLGKAYDDLVDEATANDKTLIAERDALRADAERWQRVDSHGRYWLENRGAILDCLTRHGYELLSSSSGWTLHKLPAAIDAARGKP